MVVVEVWDGGALAVAAADLATQHPCPSLEQRGGTHSLSPMDRSAADQGGKSSKPCMRRQALPQGAGLRGSLRE